MAKKRIGIVDDHKLFRDALKAMINATEDMEVVGEAGEGQGAIRMVTSVLPDLLLLDLSMPRLDGISVLSDIKREFPGISILVLTVHESDKYIHEVFEAGAEGYCLKTDKWEELFMAIQQVLAGRTFISPSIAENVLAGYIEGRRRPGSAGRCETVTPQEQQVLKLLARGYKSREISEQLFISSKTVAKHQKNILKKLGLPNPTALTAYAIEKGLVS